MTVRMSRASWTGVVTCDYLTWLFCWAVVLPAALATSAAAGGCKFPGHKTSPNLTAIAPLVGKTFSVTDPDGKYSYDIGICTKGSDAADLKFAEAGVLQTEIENKKVHNIGKFTNATMKIGTDWAMIEYRGGDPYGHHCGGALRVSIIMITCDPDVHSLDIEDVNPTLIEEENTKSSECYYLFELSHSCICNYRSKEPLVTFSLSIGSILVIVFVALCVVYFVGGLVYNRFVLGAKGMEQIPNFSFWMDFGNLQADGCNLVCRTGRRSESRSYKGVGDDQLMEEEDHDEHLLPM